MNNISALSVNQMVSLLTDAYIKTYNNGSGKMKDFPSVMLWGAPGVGKSQGVRQIAKNLEEELHIPVNVIDVRLLLFNPIDLRGIPVADKDKEAAIWLKPKIFQMSDSGCINILFLDEISAAPQSVQAAAYQITLDRKVGEHILPDNCIVMAAGNRVTDKSVATKMPKALANRLLHIEIEGSYDSWMDWAIKNGINEKVLGYITNNPDRLFGFDVTKDDVAFPTPRSWEMVSNILNNISDNLTYVTPLLNGLIGVGTAVEFKNYCKVYKNLPNIDDIFNGTETKIPTSVDSLYALVFSLTTKAKKIKYDEVKISNSLRYASKLPTDYTSLLVQNYFLFDKDYKRYLCGLDEYRSLVTKHGVRFNGSI